MNNGLVITLLCIALVIFICIPICIICKCNNYNKKYEIIREF